VFTFPTPSVLPVIVHYYTLYAGPTKTIPPIRLIAKSFTLVEQPVMSHMNYISIPLATDYLKRTIKLLFFIIFPQTSINACSTWH